jgi:hypothetical protein
MPFVSQASGFGENATAGEAFSLQITWDKEMRSEPHLIQEWSDDLGVNIYIVNLAFKYNGTYTHGQGAYDRIRLGMYTPADDVSCQQNQLSPSTTPAENKSVVFNNDPNQPMTIVMPYSPVTQTVQGCNAVEWRLLVKDGMIDRWNEERGTMETVENWRPVMEYLHG